MVALRHGGVGRLLGVRLVSALFGIVNAVLGTLLRIITLPLTLLTFGLFAIIINALLLEITDALTSNLTIDEFWWTAIWAAIILAVVMVVLELLLARVVAATERPAVAS